MMNRHFGGEVGGQIIPLDLPSKGWDPPSIKLYWVLCFIVMTYLTHFFSSCFSPLYFLTLPLNMFIWQVKPWTLFRGANLLFKLKHVHFSSNHGPQEWICINSHFSRMTFWQKKFVLRNPFSVINDSFLLINEVIFMRLSLIGVFMSVFL